MCIDLNMIISNYNEYEHELCQNLQYYRNSNEIIGFHFRFGGRRRLRMHLVASVKARDF
jgi:coproporphyrinogen III oxidase-like Fe-S oxidoreductase